MMIYLDFRHSWLTANLCAIMLRVNLNLILWTAAEHQKKLKPELIRALALMSLGTKRTDSQDTNAVKAVLHVIGSE